MNLLGRVVIVVLSSVIVLGLVESKFSESLKVSLSHGGGVYGRYLTSSSGRGIRAFRGIPYAEAPVGTLRFSDPVEKRPWTGFIEGTNQVVCPQVDILFRKTVVEGQEDCLFLNVFVPQISAKVRELLPVMFFVHGGGYVYGNGHFYGPDYLLNHDVILVTGNYRLGALGFLSTQSQELPGNYGMKDQVMMLKWIQRNIHAFGGDASKVTIFGESAGGASVGLLLMSPMAKGLFHRAILQSGTPYDPWAVLDSTVAVNNAKKLFQLVGCPYVETMPQDGIACLRGKTDVEIAGQISKYFEWDTDPLIPFGPVIENNQLTTSFINQQSFDMGSDPTVPILIGMTSHEGAFKVSTISGNNALVTDLQTRFDQCLPALATYSHFQEPRKTEMTQKLKSYYFQNPVFDWNRDQAKFIELLTDSWHLSGLNAYLTRRFAAGQAASTFVYLLSYRGEVSFTDFLQGNREDAQNFGVAHGDDLIHLFPLAEQHMNYRVPTEVDQKFREKFTKLWVDFANFGHPFKPSKEKEKVKEKKADKKEEKVKDDGKLKWQPATKFPLDYMRIGRYNAPVQEEKFKTEMVMEVGLFPERSEFWNQINNQAAAQPKKQEL